jgi:hypothetical protein
MDTRIAWGVRRTERTGRRDDAKIKRQAGKSWCQKKDLKFFVENVTVSYIVAIQDLPKKQQSHVH